MFSNNLTKEGYTEIVNEHLGQYMHGFNNGINRLLQDNSPTHRVANHLNNNNIRWVRIHFGYLKLL